MNEEQKLSLKRAKDILDGLRSQAYFSGLDASHLYDALWERIEGRVPIETDPEMMAILCEVADRLGRLEESTRPAPAVGDDYLVEAARLRQQLGETQEALRWLYHAVETNKWSRLHPLDKRQAMDKIGGLI